MADHFHDIRDLIGRNDASSFALSTDLCSHPVFICFVDRRLV
jgi:hypothetical protein